MATEKHTTRLDNNQSMESISANEYESLLYSLTDRFAEHINADPIEAHKTACDVLTNTWQPWLTADVWYSDALMRLNPVQR